MLRAAERYLSDREVDAPRLSAELLLGEVLGLARLELYLVHDRPLGEAERERLRPLVGERGRGVPLAYLLGNWDFYGLTLQVGPDVLVPRPETERLAELAIERAPRGARCVDLGTGSGAIAVALAVQRPDVTVVASDVSPAAAAVARRNLAAHAVDDRVEVIEGRDWEPFAEHGRFALLVCNPPYVDPARDDLVEAHVRQFEPHVALFTEPGDPCSAYRGILAGVEAHLDPGGWLLLETGVEAAEPALALMRAAPFLVEPELQDDLAGIPRYLVARRR